MWTIKLRRAARAIGIATNWVTPLVNDSGVSRQGRHHPARRHLPNRVVARVRHIKVARAVHRHAGWIVESRRAARAVAQLPLQR